MSIVTLLARREYENRKRHLIKLEQIIGKIAYWKGLTNTESIEGIAIQLPIEEDQDYFDISDLRWERRN